MKKHINKVLTLALALTLITASGLLAGCTGSGDETTAPSSVVAPTATEPTTAAPLLNPLTGLEGYSADAVEKRPVAIMINNIAAARPQWGLTTPDIVFETVAEGGITRMMWLYADAATIPEKVGSVRSARHYYIQMAQGFDAIFVHWGASTYAYNSIRNGDIDNLDGMAGTYFKRDTTLGRSQEHTGYTTGSLIAEGIAAKGYRTQIESKYKNPLSFATAARTLPGGACQTLSCSFSDHFDYSYRYNAEDSLYYSYLNENAFVDSEGAQQSFTNLIIIYAPITSLNDSKGRMTVDFDGGNGVYVSNGTYENITWTKGEGTDVLKFFGSDGSALQLNPGRSYIGLVPSGRESYTTIA